MSDSRAVDQESRRLIREEPLTNILLEAGAGSGKTQMLAERMAAGVAAGVYNIEHMAAVTFTRKAASELRGRFHLALEKELSEARRVSDPGCAPDSDRAARVQSALSNLERFFGGTIHSFCARLLRERPVESGVSPGFTELDEVQDLELRQRAWRDFITSGRAAGDPDMTALVEADVRIRYVSLHQWPLYPGTGRAEERGVGNVFNVPRPPGLPRATYVRDLREAVERATRGWRPQLLLISAGFDAMAGDPLAGFTLEPEDYAEWIRAWRALDAPIASVLEGGYVPHRIRRAAAEHLHALG